MKFSFAILRLLETPTAAVFILLGVVMGGCSKNSSTTPPPPPPAFTSSSVTINDKSVAAVNYYINTTPVIKFSFSTTIDQNSVSNNISFAEKSGASVNFNTTYENSDSSVVLQPSAPLNYITKYVISVSTALKSKAGGTLRTSVAANFTTQIDSTDKFMRVSDDALLNLIQQQTFKYFWDFGHPVSGMARERNTSGDVVTTGGTGFGVMSIVAAVSRNFITRAEGLQRINTIVNFLINNCTRYHGAFSHWINGTTGTTVPFSANDDGADLVETSLLMQGLLCARQYFNTVDANETLLRTNINFLWNAIEWNWFRQVVKMFCTGIGVPISVFKLISR